MNLDQANLIVEAFIKQAGDLQNLALEESDPRVKEFLLVEAAKQCQAASAVPTLPLSV
jgi:hypothetical protein